MKVCVVGAGGVGGLLAATSRRAGVGTPMVMPSMAVDIIAGKRLDYAWLGGRVRELGKEHGVPKPANDFIAAALTPFLSGKQASRAPNPAAG